MSSNHRQPFSSILLCVPAILFCATGIAQTTQSLTQLPPLVEAGVAEHHVGKVIWQDLVTPNVAVAKGFYGGLFGWTFRDLLAPYADYTVAMQGDQPVAGFLQRASSSSAQHQSAWLAFFAVADLDTAQRNATAHGAKLLAGPKDYPQRGRQAILRDPDGAVFALLASTHGDPPDALPAPGEWIWSSLHTGSPGGDAAFYQTLLGYDVFDQAGEAGAEHVILSSEDYARASVNGYPAGATRLHPHWLNFVRVLSVAETAAKVAGLGGKILVAPHLDRHGGQLAVVADPAGAAFGIMEWTADDSKAEPK